MKTQTQTQPKLRSETDIRLNAGYYTITELAEQLGIARRVIQNLLRRELIPKPTKKWICSPKNFYDAADIANIKNLLGIK